MSWALRHRGGIRKAILLLGGVMIAVNLLVGPTPFGGRLLLVAVNVVIVPFAFFGVRWVFQLQIAQHGLRPWIRQFAAAAFFGFGGAAIIAIPVSFASREVSPWAAGFLMFATIAYSALATIARAEERQVARPAS